MAHFFTAALLLWKAGCKKKKYKTKSTLLKKVEHQNVVLTSNGITRKHQNLKKITYANSLQFFKWDVLFVFWLIQPWQQNCSCPTHFLSLYSIHNSENIMSTSLISLWGTHTIYILLPLFSDKSLQWEEEKKLTSRFACVPLLCWLHLLPHMNFLCTLLLPLQCPLMNCLQN